MSDWAKKRFWKTTDCEKVDGGYRITLDGRSVKTPAKAELVVPTLGMAQAMVSEWDAQEGKIDPATMPVTRSANAAIDKVSIQFAEVADMLAEYGGSDLLCYRADSPDELVSRQNNAWNPLLDWAEKTLGARLEPITGVVFQPQSSEAMSTLTQKVHGLDNFELAAFHDLVSLSGSLVIGFAAVHELHTVHDLWALSRIDETWQEEQWGIDEDAQLLALTKYQAFAHACQFFKMSKP